MFVNSQYTNFLYKKKSIMFSLFNEEPFYAMYCIEIHLFSSNLSFQHAKVEKIEMWNPS